MRFSIHPAAEICKGNLTYVSAESSFRFDAPTCEDSYSSIVVNDLQLEIDHQGRVLYVWGYCPRVSWRKTSLRPPMSSPGCLVALIDPGHKPGISIRFTTDIAWPVFVDEKEGWVCLGDARQSESEISIEFAQDSVAVLRGSELRAIWLRPRRILD